MTIIHRDQLVKIIQLFENKIDDSYITLYEKDGSREIVQYSAKYDDVHIAFVKDESLKAHNKVCLD